MGWDYLLSFSLFVLGNLGSSKKYTKKHEEALNACSKVQPFETTIILKTKAEKEISTNKQENNEPEQNEKMDE